jgi:hypothetical protein
MHRPRTLRLVTPLIVGGLLAVAPLAQAQERGQATVQLAPLPVQQQPQTVIIQQPYPSPVYQTAPVPQYGPPPGQTYYVQAPPQGPAVPTGPRVLRNWDDSQPIPPGYHAEEHARKGLVIGGAVLFGSMYLLSALVAAVDSDAYQGQSNPAAALWVPAVGPFIQMGNTGSATAGVFLAIDGLAQIGGIAMFTIGLADPKTEMVRNDLGSIHVKLAPIIASGHEGMGLVGTF